MKLTTEQTQHVASQLQAQAIPDEHPSTDQLRQVIGDHTFFLDDSGLHIVEQGTAPNGAEPRVAALQVASWSQDTDGQLHLHEPQVTQAVSIDPAGPQTA